MPKLKIPKLESNILKNMWVSCSNKTAKAFSEMINRKVNVSSTSLKIVLINEVPQLLNLEDITTTVVFMQLLGSIKGVLILSSPLKNILKIADIFLHREPGHFKDLSDENLPVIKELASILAGYYATTLNKIFDTNYQLSTPFLYVNPYRAIERFGFGSVYKEEIRVLSFKASFDIAQEGIKNDIILLFREDSTEKIVETVSNKVKFDIE
jgi:chemotaxis protein CheY-P-specific phosphatase CheC